MRFLSFIAFLFVVSSAFGQDSSSTVAADTAVKVYQLDTGKTYIVEINRLIQTAEKHLGTPYRYAGKTPAGFDCSGFVYYCYGSTLGIKMPASSTDYVHFGQAVSKDSAKPGDIIVFKGYNAGGTGPGHVGMITEITANEIYFIHSANRGGIRYDKLSQKYYKDRFLFIRRVLK